MALARLHRHLVSSAVAVDLHRHGLLYLVAAAPQRPAEGSMIFSGTVASPNSFPAGPQDIDIRLEDPIGGRMIRHAFRIEMLSPLGA